MSSPGNCRFVPPYLLRQLASSGALDPAYVEACLRLDDTMRVRREQPAAWQPIQRATDSRWTVHSAGNTETLPGDPVRSEGEPESGDPAADEAATGITATLDLFRDLYRRDSYDAAGARVLLTVHYGRSYANAFWDGSHLVFGDGDGRVFQRFTRAVDVLAHEFGHAVTEHTAALVYQAQSGALNESVSDVFAISLKQRLLGQDATGGSWLIGEELFAPGIDARGLRDLAAPGTAYDDPLLGRDPQPAHMDDYVETTDDNGGVHINSGIPNRAFALAAQAIGGSTAEGAGRVWYAALTSGHLPADADFGAFAAATVAAAGEAADAVRSAWEQVGVAVGESSTTGPPPAVEPVAAGQVVVRRTGGIVGQVVEAAVDPAADDDRARQVRELLGRVDLAAAATGEPQPDRYVYAVRIGEGEPFQVSEAALSGDLRRLVELVLDADG
jgi:hypothetical protein